MMAMLAKARDAETRAGEARDALTKAAGEAEAARTDLTSLDDECAAMRHACGASSNEEVTAIAARADDARRLRRELADTRAELLKAGDGHAEDKLHAELADTPLDAAAAEQEEIGAEERLPPKRRRGPAKRDAQHARGGPAAAVAAQEAANAAQEAAALAERWAVA